MIIKFNDFEKLNESYKSQKELEILTKSILDDIAETFYKHDFNFDYCYTKLKKFNYNNYTILKDFLINFKELNIFILDEKESYKYIKSMGSYNIREEDDSSITRYILLKYNDILDYDKYLYNDDYTKNINDKDFLDYFKDRVKRIYSDTLIHELQHAFDDFRSNGNAILHNYNDEEESKKYKKLKQKRKLKQDEIDFMNDFFKKYLNLKHEVDARFTQAIQKIDFYEMDIDKMIELNSNNFIYKMKDFKDVLRSFKSNYYAFVVLSDKDKKRMLRKLGQFYEYEKDYIKKLNQSSIKI